MDNRDILLIHLGGLGDVCLSESLFFSFQKHFGNCLAALGNKRFLDLFSEYFLRAEGIESRKWLYLFSEKLNGPVFKRIIFIGKDREGLLRKRWKAFSEEEIIFIDMYPESAFQSVNNIILPTEKAAPTPGIEAYQLAQLKAYGVAPLQKEILPKKSQRIIIYPEKGFTKEKLHHDNFLRLYSSLLAKGLEVIALESLGLKINVDHKVSLEDLTEIKRFFSEGGIFVSNDSGMAHLAGVSGLFTITVFTGFDPTMWHPRGRNISLIMGQDILNSSDLETIILKAVNDWNGPL